MIKCSWGVDRQALFAFVTKPLELLAPKRLADLISYDHKNNRLQPIASQENTVFPLSIDRLKISVSQTTSGSEVGNQGFTDTASDTRIVGQFPDWSQTSGVQIMRKRFKLRSRSSVSPPIYKVPLKLTTSMDRTPSLVLLGWRRIRAGLKKSLQGLGLPPRRWKGLVFQIRFLFQLLVPKKSSRDPLSLELRQIQQTSPRFQNQPLPSERPWAQWLITISWLLLLAFLFLNPLTPWQTIREEAHNIACPDSSDCLFNGID